MMLGAISRIHAAARPKISREGFVSDYYGISLRELQLIDAGRRSPSLRFLLRVRSTHAGLLPDEPLVLTLPHQRVHVWPGDLSITFPSQNPTANKTNQ